MMLASGVQLGLFRRLRVSSLTAGSSNGWHFVINCEGKLVNNKRGEQRATTALYDASLHCLCHSHLVGAGVP